MTWAKEVIQKAVAAANAAINEEIATNGPEDPTAFDCGFAWVHVPNGRCKFVRECRQELSRYGIEPNGNMRQGWFDRQNDADVREARSLFGSEHYQKGWEFWGPGKFRGQSVRIKEAGARGFARTLQDHGIECHVGSRLD